MEGMVPHLLRQFLETGLCDLGLCDLGLRIATSRSSWQGAALRLREGHRLHFCLWPSATLTLSMVAWEHGKVESWHSLWAFLIDVISGGGSEVLLSSGYL